MFWQGEYSFFDYKYHIAGYNGQDFDGPARWFYLAFTLGTILILLIAFRNAKKKRIEGYLRVPAVIMPLLEIGKVVWESYFDIATGRGFNWCGLLPIYTCSLFLYTMPFAAFGKGKVREYALSWICTLGLVGGLSNVLFIQGLKWYPFFTFGGFYSMIFHYIMVFTALFTVVTRFKVFHLKDTFRAMAVHGAFSLIVIPIDYLKHWDYMQYYEAGGVPVIEDVVKGFTEKGVQWLAVPLMLLLYFALAAVFTLLYTGYGKLNRRGASK